MSFPVLLLYLISVLRAVVEVAGIFLLAQGVLFFIAGSRRAGNPVYQLFAVVTRPALAIVARLLPRAVADRHLPLITFALLFWVWVGLAYVRLQLTSTLP